MARIFNIYFSFKGLDYNAIVSIRKTPYFTEYALNNINEHLLTLLPGNKIISRIPGEFIFQHSSDSNSSELMEIIIQAVVGHLQNTTV